MQSDIKNIANTDPIDVYDPYLSAIDGRKDYPHMRGGYKIWPDGKRVAEAKHRIMCIGNSTSLWPSADWSQKIGKALLAQKLPIAIYNGAGKGHTSSQELMRVVRDTSGIAPTLIVSLSGICDIGYLQNAKNQPFSHKYTRRAMNVLRDSGTINEVSYGYPDPSTPAQAWCRNQYLMAVIARGLGSQIISFLQATQGYGTYTYSEKEKDYFNIKAKVILKAIDKPYGDCVTDFYAEVKDIIAAQPADFAHVIDFTDVFADCPGAYRDHRHQSEEGVAYLARCMLPIVEQKIAQPNIAITEMMPAAPKSAIVKSPSSEVVKSPSKDKIGLYDPLMGSVSPVARWPNAVGGYKVWPEDKAASDAADLRIMSMGNSTSLWPSAAWSMELGEMIQSDLAPDNRSVAIYNGAGKGSTSSQEVMRVMRDAPGIAPSMIVSLSGICDIGYLISAANQPFAHKYTRRVMDFVREDDIVSDIVFGYPDSTSPAAVWCRNQRMIGALARELNVPILTFLQPVQGFGVYPQTQEEIDFLAKKGQVILSATKEPYIEAVTEFYTQVLEIIRSNPSSFSHVIDFTDVFADCPGAYRDHRHQAPKGVTHLATKMHPIVSNLIQFN
jgi:hypothetical protein